MTSNPQSRFQFKIAHGSGIFIHWLVSVELPQYIAGFGNHFYFKLVL